MPDTQKSHASWFERHFSAIAVVLLAGAVFAFTWVGIKESRRDSLNLLIMQGTSFTEALAQAAENAIEAEAFFDYLVHRRYDEIVVTLSQMVIDDAADVELAQAAVQHDIEAIYLTDLQGSVLAAGAVPGAGGSLPEFVLTEIGALGSNPETNYVLLLEPGDRDKPALHYYLQIANTLDRIVVIVADARYYVEALRRTQIGYLVQNMAREPGVEYIIYQSTDGIIFASRRTGRLLAIESDPFLKRALDTDSIMHRVYDFNDREVLELVRPFATDEYPFGLFRVGLSLDRFYTVSRGFDRLMAVLGIVLFGLVLLSLMYVFSRRKRRELRRRYSDMKSMTDLLFDQMRTGVAAVDETGSITLTNRAFEKIVGVTAVVGRDWDTALDIPELSLSRLETWKRTSEEQEVTVTIGGRESTLVVAVSEYRPHRSHKPGLVIVIYDVSRLKDYERKAARRARLSEMGNLAAGVAHEIRNPLNTISIAAQRLASEFVPEQDAEEFKAFTNQIRTETKRLNEIITRFLDLAREEKKGERSIRLDRVLNETAGFLKLEAEQLGLELTTNIEPGLEIQADPDAVKQVLTNLFNNAKEAVGRGPGKIGISAHRREDRVVVEFEDSGPGIPSDLREKVLTPYFTTKDSGTGLGLPTVHRIITDLGGEVRIEDSDLGGARIILIF